MLQLKRNALVAICGISIGLGLSACADAPFIKWWFIDGLEAQALVRKECDKDGENCVIKEQKSFVEADGYYAISASDWEAQATYIKALKRKAKECHSTAVAARASTRTKL